MKYRRSGHEKFSDFTTQPVGTASPADRTPQSSRQRPAEAGGPYRATGFVTSNALCESVFYPDSRHLLWRDLDTEDVLARHDPNQLTKN